MGDSLSVRLQSIFRNTLHSTNEESWFWRVRQNAQAFFEFRGAAALAHGGAGAFGLLENRPEAERLRRQAASVVVHAVVIAALLLFGRTVIKPSPDTDKTQHGSGPLLFPRLAEFLPESKPGGKGAGSNHDLLLPSSGNLAPHSTMVLLHPRLPDEQPHALPVEPTILDPNASTQPQHVRDLGLPWMEDPNYSNGKDGGDSIGTKRGNRMGSTDGDEEGESEDGMPYARGAYPVRCVYCPDPVYTDEARKAKMQGSVTLEVFVRADGRVGRVKIMKGLGLGLDESALDAVKAWRFEPARDGAKHAISQWVTVETTYRLF